MVRRPRGSLCGRGRPRPRTPVFPPKAPVMYDSFRLMFDVSDFTYCTVAALTALAGILIYAMTDSRGITAAFSPAAAFGAFCGIFAFKEAGLILSPDKDVNVLIASAAGMFLAVSVMLLVIRVYYAAVEIRKPVTKTNYVSR